MRAAALGLVLLLLVAGLAQAGSWTQRGGNAQRTGFLGDVGPKTNDTAIEVQLPGSVYGFPVIHNGSTWVFTRPWPFEEDPGRTDLTEAALWRIHLDSGDVEKVTDVADDAVHFTDGERLISWDLETFTLRSLTDLTILWESPIPPTTTAPGGEPSRMFCGDYAILEDRLVVSCEEDILVDSPAGTIHDGRGRAAVLSYDLSTGALQWDWRQQSGQKAGVGSAPVDLAYGDLSTDLIRHSSSATHTMVYTLEHDSWGREGLTLGQALQYRLWSLDTTTGDLLWSRNDTMRATVPMDLGPIHEYQGRVTGGRPLIGDNQVYVRLDRLYALNPSTGEPIWQVEVGQQDERSTAGTTGMALAEGVLYATSIQSIYAFDALTGASGPLYTFPPGSPELFSATAPMIIADGIVYAEVWRTDRSGHGVRAFDAETLDLLWAIDLYDQIGPVSQSSNIGGVADGVFVKGARDGKVVVIGETPASISLPELPPEAWPSPSEPVEIDLGDTVPGAFGPATAFLVDWGDGARSGWTPNPVFTHAYQEPGIVRARVWARNDANQTTSEVITMNVGGTPPPELNAVQKVFAAENQDTFWGVVGLLLALGGGLYAVLARRRRRDRLQRELAAIEAAHAKAGDSPAAIEAAHTERRAHVHGLMVDGKLDEAQLAILEKRIDELARSSRTAMLDERFHFLPHGLVLSLRDMLADGRINAWERDQVLAALEADQVMNKTQKRQVRRLVETWFERDEGSEPS